MSVFHRVFVPHSRKSINLSKGVHCPCSALRSRFTNNKDFSGEARSFYDDHIRAQKPRSIFDSFINHAVVKPNDEILDVGCGAGITAVALAKQGPQKVVGVDTDEATIGLARQHAQINHLGSVATFRPSMLTELPFPNESFSLVTQRLGFHHFHEYQRVFAEMARVCRKGGRIVIMDVTVESDDGGQPNIETIDLSNAVAALRDPSHVRFLMDNEMEELMTMQHGLVDFRAIGGKALSVEMEVEEWVILAGNYDQSHRLIPLLRGLWKQGTDTGMALTMDDSTDDLYFTQHYRIWSALKP